MANEFDSIAKTISEVMNYNGSFSSIDEICNVFIAKYHPQASHSVVSALTAHHYPTEVQMEKIDEWINHYSMQSKQQNIISEFIDMKMDLIKKREDVFFIVNEGTYLSCGLLKEGKSEIDRDDYIQTLNVFYTLSEKIKDKLAEGEHNRFYEALCQSLVFSSPSYVCGDIESLGMLYNASKGYTVPDFSHYNKLK